MRPTFLALACIASLSATLALPAQAAPEWTQPNKPFRIHGNAYYVGSRGLTAVLVTSPQGHVLIDGTLPENAAMVEANIRSLGFKLSDIKAILNSHAHVDHAGAIAQLARDTGATVYASALGAKSLALGGADPDDPQYQPGPGYTPVKATVVVDGGHVKVGPLDIQAHATPGHTPGSTSWTWRSCEAGECVDIVYADSLTALTNGTYRYADSPAHPHRVESFRQSIATVGSLPCGILVTTHPDASDVLGRAARGKLQDPGACKALAAHAVKALDAELAREAAAQR
jgi:metallo-beta-lactamase class B